MLLLSLMILLLAAGCLRLFRSLTPPAHLQHIPSVPILPLLISYLSGEVEAQRVKRLVLPFARRIGTNVVLVFCLGEWMVQILEPQARLSPLLLSPLSY